MCHTSHVYAVLYCITFAWIKTCLTVADTCFSIIFTRRYKVPAYQKVPAFPQDSVFTAKF